MKKIGLWKWDESQLPKYEYTGGYPAIAIDKHAKDSGQPKDPSFILGNYRLTMFAHVSGMYELISGERGWARLNHGGTNQGWNQSTVRFAGADFPYAEVSYDLVGDLRGTGIQCFQSFGTGYAKYTYHCQEQVFINKIISVQPSEECATGNAAFLLEVTVENKGNNPITINYTEQLLSNYCMMTHQGEEPGSASERIIYENQMNVDASDQMVKSDIICKPVRFMVLPESPEQSFTYDCFPPELFLKVVESDNYMTKMESIQSELGDVLSASIQTKLSAGESKTIRMVSGYSFEKDDRCIQNQIEDMVCKIDQRIAARSEGAYAYLWKRILPDFTKEADEVLRCEMTWNAYVLECMATYHQYFDETYIPQGSVYAYHLGQNASNRDHLQHLLPLIYTNPRLAKSALRFAMKHTLPDGEICRQDVGYGYRDPGIFMESDAQIYMIMAIGEYLRITKDYEILQENIEYYPVEYGKKDTVLHVIMKHFIYLRDTVGVGQHGLVRMLNSDWSDSFFHPYSPNIYWHFAESHMNSTMVLSSIPTFVTALEQYLKENECNGGEIEQLITEMRQYRESLYKAFMKDMEGRTFSPRCYLCEDDEPELKFGLETLCIEAQPYVLQMEDFPLERKQVLLQEIKSRVMDMEKIGARTREVPLWDKRGEAEDGGIWFSHQGALMTGMATVEKKEAIKLLKKLTFHHFAEEYPEYWLGHWTYADSLESSFNEKEGLYHFWIEEAFQPFCAHAHAWMLYNYYKINETEITWEATKC